MSTPIGATELAELLTATGRHHHAAYRASDGVDPEWALWYAPYLQARLGDRLGGIPTRGELVYLLIAAERAHAGDETVKWPDFYAAFILEHHDV